MADETSMSGPRRELTLGEHLFWTIMASTTACLMIAVVLFVGS